MLGEQKYLGEIPMASVRPMSDEERHWLNRSYTSAQNKWLVWLILTWACPFMFILALALAISHAVPQAVAIFLTFTTLAMCIFAPLRWIDTRKTYRFLKQTLPETTVESYFLPPCGEMEYELTPNGCVIRDHGKLPSFITKAETILVADRPEQPDTQEFPQQFLDIHGHSIRVRPMSVAEKAEIKRLIPQPFTFWNIVVFLILAAINVDEILAIRNQAPDASYLRLGLFLILDIYLIRKLWVNIKVTEILQKDLAEGTVLSDDYAEYLPHSRLLWTVEKTPHPWRMGKRFLQRYEGGMSPEKERGD